MASQELEYNFHDSTIVECALERVDKFYMILQLYEIFYPSKGFVKLTFSGVFNSEKVSQLIVNLQQDNLESNWNGTRVNSINYETKKISQEQDLYVHISLDGYVPLTIHFKQLKIEKLGQFI